MITKDETISDRIRQRLEAVGKTAHAASIEAGGSPSLIPNILNGRSQNPRLDTLNKIAEVLGTSGEWLMYGTRSVVPPGHLPNEVRPADVPFPNRQDLPQDVPVLGTVAASNFGRGAFQLTTDVIEYVRRPQGLMGVRDVYALYVENDSMWPKFEDGELIYVSPHRKAQSGDYIVIQEPGQDGIRGFVKRLVKITGSLLRTEQFNPPAELDFPLNPGLIWHKVVTGNELYGI